MNNIDLVVLVATKCILIVGTATISSSNRKYQRIYIDIDNNDSVNIGVRWCQPKKIESSLFINIQSSNNLCSTLLCSN